MSGLFLFITGLVTFLFGFSFVGSGSDGLAEKKIRGVLTRINSNRTFSALSGGVLTMLFGSGAAVNGCVSAFVDRGIISVFSGAAIVIGGNTGSTIVTHITALGELFDTSAPCAVFLVSGIVLYSLGKNDGIKENLGKIFLGTGFVFVGIKTLSDAVEFLSRSEWFKAVFLIKSPPILLLNGFFISAIFQSSSGVSAVVAILCNENGLDFLSAAYLIVGANIGSCVPLVVLERNKNDGRKVAVFNLSFNFLCAVCFFSVLPIIHGTLKSVPASGRFVAIFHTALNALTAIPALVFLKPLVKLNEKLCSLETLAGFEKSKNCKKKSKNFKVDCRNN